MLINTRCIALRTIKFKDTQSIVSCLVRGLGRVSFVVNTGAGREARRRQSLMMPGSSFECVVDYRDGRSLQTLRDITPMRPMMLDSPLKTSVVLFLCDFLNALMRDCEPDDVLFEYVDMTIGRIVATDGSVANETLCALIGLQRVMGIEPDLSTYRPGRVFDMQGGAFRDTPPAHSRWLDRDKSAAAAKLARINPRNARLFKFTRSQRAEALDTIIDYFSIHFGAIRGLHSIDVLRSIFD